MGAYGSSDAGGTTVNVASAAAVSTDPGLRPGDEPATGGLVGRYLILEELGRGGMGRVVRAYDPKLQREVAVKLLHRRAMSEDNRARLIREARSMARLNHPNVVAVYDIESDDTGELMLAMELVEGRTLRQWLSEAVPSPSRILDAFCQAGRGLAAAHGEGIVHRDFKPSNVLVSTQPARGSSDALRVRVTDFGLARPVLGDTSEGSGGFSGPSSSDGLVTERGTVAGTPRYMAPEQHEGRQATAAADQYALCVALWEALCGRPPFAGSRVAEQKCEGPPRWSGARGVHSAIGTVLRRGLEPEPARRWPSVKVLLDELDRHRTKRIQHLWVGGLALGVSGLLTLVGAAQARSEAPCTGAAEHLRGVWDDAQRAEVREAILRSDLNYAEAVWRHVEVSLGSYADRWIATHTEACEATAVHGRQSATDLDLRMRCLQRGHDALAAVADLLARGEPDIVERAHALLRGLPDLQRCNDVEALRSSVPMPTAEQAQQVATAQQEIAAAKAATDAGRYAEAMPLVESAGNRVNRVGYAPLRTELALERGYVHDHLGEFDEAQHDYEQALSSAMAWRQWRLAARAASQLVFVVGSRLRRPDEVTAWIELSRGLTDAAGGSARADLLMALGSLASKRADYEEALRLQEELLTLQRDTRGRDSPSVAMTLDSLAHSLYELGRYDEAETRYREAMEIRQRVLPDGHPDHAMSFDKLAGLLRVRGDHREAVELQTEALRIREAALGPDHVHVAATRVNLADTLVACGEYDRAEEQLLLGIENLERRLGPNHPHLAVARSSLTAVYRKQERYADAETQGRASLAIRLEAHPADHPAVGLSRGALSSVLHERGALDEAEQQARDAVTILSASVGDDHMHTATARHNLASILADRGGLDEALEVAQRALESLSTTLGEDHPETAAAQTRIGSLLLRMGDNAAAKQILARAWKTRQREDIPSEERAATAYALARAHFGLGERDRAVALGLEAAELFGPETSERVEVSSWLGEVRRGGGRVAR